jgi:hypothetical protein
VIASVLHFNALPSLSATRFPIAQLESYCKAVVAPDCLSFRSDFGLRARFGDRVSPNTRLEIPSAPGWISELFT